jgi:head-tail adaptor
VLTAAELAAMRAVQKAALPETATIRRATASRTTTGGTSLEWSDAGTAACRLSSRGVPQEYLEAGAARGVQYWMVTLPYGTDVRREDRLVIAARMLEVVGLASGGEWETAMRVVCAEVR